MPASAADRGYVAFANSQINAPEPETISSVQSLQDERSLQFQNDPYVPFDELRSSQNFPALARSL